MTVCGRSLAGVAGSNPAGIMDVCVCVVSKDKKAKCRMIKTKKQVWMKYKQSKREYKKVPVGPRFSASVQTSLGVHPGSYTTGI